MESAKDVGKNVEVNEYQDSLNELYENATNGEDVYIKQKHIKGITECRDVLQELVDKATPFKPLNQEIEGVNFVLYGQCKCGCEVWEGWKFCVDCGQPLDWSKDER